MKYIMGFFAFWYDFIVGDAWEVAAGVLLTLIALYLLAHYAGSSLSTYGALLFPVISWPCLSLASGGCAAPVEQGLHRGRCTVHRLSPSLAYPMLEPPSRITGCAFL